MAFLNRILFVLLVGCICTLFEPLFVQVCHAQDTHPTLEYQIKASLIFNFLQFVIWPPDSPGQVQSAMHICVVGPDHFGSALSALEREVIHGKRTEVIRYAHPANRDLADCQVLFISAGSESDEGQIISAVKDLNVLTIGESANFLDEGGIITLLLDGNRVVFDVNRRAALQARLEISSKLLRVARQVKE